MPKLVAIREASQSNICRTCLQEGTVKSIYDDCANGICILEKLVSCTLVPFTENDGLPSNICSACLKQIDDAYLFSQKCEEVDKILRKYYQKPLVGKTKRNRQCCGENSEQEAEVPPAESSNTNNEILNAPVEGINFIILTSDSDEEIANQPEREPEHETKNKENEEFVIFEDNNTVQKENEPNPKKYKCKKCDIYFPVFHLLKEHYRKPEHINQTTKVCEICSKVVRYKNYYKHINSHKNSSRYCCEYCGRYFNNDSNLLRHRNIHLGIKPYLCDICGRKFTQSSAMKAHRRIHTGEKPYVCPICGRTFHSNTTLNGHVQMHQKEDDPSAEKRQRVHKDMPIEEWLDKEIVSREQNASKQETDKVECEICKQKFRTPAGLKTHQVIHEEKNFNCTNCSRKFSTLERLETHMKVHSADRPFSCHVCGKTFITKMCLKNHVFLHTGRKPYSCEYCDKSFVHLGQLRAHALIHTGNKPHICKYCGKAFALNGNLTVHMRKHTGEYPFICGVCNKGFVDTSALKKHQRTHSAANLAKN